MTRERDEDAARRGRAREVRQAVLYQLALRGVVRRGDLLAAVGASEGELSVALSALETKGQIARRTQAGFEQILPSALGREQAAAAIAAEAELLQSFIRPLDAAFGRLNRRVKEILRRWQVRVDRAAEELNDHSDVRYDRHVLAELRSAYDSADVLLAGLEPLRPRYGNLRRRLREALARAHAGDPSAVAGVSGDSFHNAWWELHADFLAILGRTRGADDA